MYQGAADPAAVFVHHCRQTSGASTRSAWRCFRPCGTAAPSSPAAPSACLPGCSPGAAPRCCRAMWRSPRSAQPPGAPRPAPRPGRAARAAPRLAGLLLRPHRVLRVPDDFGDHDLERVLNSAVAALEPDGTLLAVHWRHPVADYPRSGDDVHQVLADHPGPGSPRPSRRARLPRRGSHPHRRDAGIGGPGDGPGVSGLAGTIAAAGVVVPAHDEEALLPACLAALRQTARHGSAQTRPKLLYVIQRM